MTEFILDASAVLALLQKERGKERVFDILDISSIARINACEVLTTLINRGSSLKDAIDAFDGLELSVIEFDEPQSTKTAELRMFTKHLGLSLGDRACLALAIQEHATAVTSDRNWKSLDVCKIEIIR